MTTAPAGTLPHSILRDVVLPFLMVFGTLLVAAVVADFVLHRLALVWVGRYLGILGTILILLSFVYSLRKRKIIESGNPRTLLTAHAFLAWLGSVFILIHGGVHFTAVLPWLATAAMLVNVLSGLTGKILLDRSRRHLADRRQALIAGGLTEDAADRQLFWDTLTFGLMKKWREVHIPITIAFVVLAVGHILGIFLFWGWS